MTCRAWHDQRLETLGLLAAGLAHDVNNLLTVIDNYACLVLEAEEPPDADAWRRARHDVGQIQRAARRGGELTARLLGYARPEATTAAVLSVNAVVSETLGLLRGAFPPGVEIVPCLATECWPVRTDPVRLGQALVNLAVNARDAMPEGGTLTVCTANAGDDPGPRVRLEVTDTGCGIPPELIDRVFEPFFTTKPVGSGTGLGLAMVRDYVADLGGEVRVESPTGGGTRFELLLPAATATADPAAAVA